MDELSVDLQLEVLEGCSFRCKGCYVEKSASLRFGGSEVSRLLKLFEEFKGRGYRLDHLIMGPGDFSTTTSFEAVTDLASFGQLTGLFGTTNWTTTLLSPHWREKVRKISRVNRSQEATFSFVLNPQRVREAKYLDDFARGSRELASIYGKPIRRFYVVFNAYPHGKTEAVDFKRDYLEVHQRVTATFSVPTFDHGLSFARTESLRESKDRILESVRWLNEVYDSISGVAEIPIEFVNPADYLAKRYVFRNERFFVAPLWYEPFISFDPELEIPLREWTVAEFEAFERAMLLRQYDELEDTVCEDCGYNALCLKRGIVHLKTLLGEEACISPLKALEARGYSYHVG